VASDDYKERVSYDANGNILTYLRNGATGVNGLAMDSLTYQYARNNAGQLINNRLRYVHDRVADNAYTEDIDSQTPLTLNQVQAEKLDAQNTDNYQYDEIGNLIKDTKEGITAIEWNVYGKIKSITKGSMTITYTYDAAGNRISKEVDPASGPTRKTYYVRDATGNVMSVYEEGGLVNDGNLTQAEVHLYGSSRLGIFKPDVDMTSLVATDVYGFDRGKKFFELSNHLGNVLVTVTDRKNGVRLSTDTTLVEYYLPDIASANDYYPFGMTMPGRSVHSDKYRYGFNGKENDLETDLQDYGFRIYNPGLGRFLSVDPLTKSFPWYTPYQFAGNKVIAFIDLDGGEDKYYMVEIWLNKTGTSLEKITVADVGYTIINNGIKQPLPQGPLGAGIQFNVQVRYWDGNTLRQEEAGTAFVAKIEKNGVYDRINNFFSGLRKFGYILKGNEGAGGGSWGESGNGNVEHFEELDISLLLAYAGMSTSELKPIFKSLKGKGIDKVTTILMGAKSAADLIDKTNKGVNLVKEIISPDEQSSASPTVPTDNPNLNGSERPNSNTSVPLNRQKEKLKDTIFRMYTRPSGGGTSNLETATREWQDHKRKNPKSKSKMTSYDQKTKIRSSQ
jgi:RHS repeat-associated protein